ncbi:hypothetical protein C2G38_2256446 [Gigaspora rosea]|uniref:Uncharacterized protein n=1 Tax=Gigaspora rosea TaxID=44941 RepID=A0A397U1G2_9GLOM|nr:hypothetical protein C2G38_2256446 [Gigaspora rosea]
MCKYRYAALYPENTTITFLIFLIIKYQKHEIGLFQKSISVASLVATLQTIIEKGIYLPHHKLKYTRRPGRYSIPHNYIVQTTYFKKNYTIKCSIEYIDDQPLYSIHFEEYLEQLVESTKSTSHTAELYCKALFEDIKNKNEQLNQTESKSKLSGPLLFGLLYKSIEAIRKTLSSNMIKIKLFNSYSKSMQRLHTLDLGKPKLEINNHTYIINYEKINSQSLTKLDESLIWASAVYEMRQEITHKVNIKIPISLVDVDQPTTFEPITEEADITDPNIVSNILASIEKDKIQKPESHYILVLFPGIENYNSLENALAPLISDLQFLDEHGFYDNQERYWNVELYFSSDWKFLAICLEMNAANANYFCPWCYCYKDNLTNTTEYSTITKNMQNIKESYLTLNGHIRPPLFNMVPIKHWVCDSLHIMLKISDRLWKLFLSDLQSGELNENFQNLIIAKMKRLNVTFYFWTDKKIQKRAGFFELYNLMNSPNTTGLQFKIKAESWLNLFLKPSRGQPNQSNFVRDGEHEEHRRLCIIEILEHENCELFYQLFEIPNYFKDSSYSKSTQRLYTLDLEKRLLDVIEGEKENFFHSNDNIVLKQAKFEINNHTYIINYGKINSQLVELQKQAIVKSIDHDRISQDAYRSLTKLDESLIRASAVYEMRQEITHKVNIKIPISLVDVDQLTTFEPITEKADITDPNIVSNILASIEKDKIQKPESHYILVLFPGIENYNSLENALAPLISDLQFLDEHGFYDNQERYWNVELYFSSDWKFLAICLEMNAANANYFCPWCYCYKDNLTNTTEYSTITKNMQNIKESYLTLNGHIRPPLFNMVPIKHWVCDSLHIMLKISDRLWKLFLSDLQSGELNENFQNLIIAKMKRLNVTFYFWTDKKIQKRAGFFELYNLMNSPNTTGLQFKIKAESWLNLFLKPSRGQPNQSNFVRDGEHEEHRRLCIIEILEHENCELFYQLFEIPNYFKEYIID